MSVLAELRAEREAELAPKRLALSVPGSRVYVQYAPIAADDLQGIIGQADGDMVTGNARVLARACVAVLVRDPETGDLRSLADEARKEGVRLDGELTIGEELVEVLGLTVKDAETGEGRAPASAAETVLALFATATSAEIAVGQHGEMYAAWLAESVQTATGDVLGGR